MVEWFPILPWYPGTSGPNSPEPAFHTVQLPLRDYHLPIWTQYGTLPPHLRKGALVTFSTAGFGLPFDIQFQVSVPAVILGQWIESSLQRMSLEDQSLVVVLFV